MSTLGAIAEVRGQFLRFAFLGVLKTVATAVLLYALQAILPPHIAYTLLYVAGLVIVALVTPRYVFGVRASRLSIALLLLWYVVVYLVGLAVLSVLHAESHSRALVAFGTVFVTAPLSFVGARFLMVRQRPSSSSLRGS